MDKSPEAFSIAGTGDEFGIELEPTRMVVMLVTADDVGATVVAVVVVLIEADGPTANWRIFSLINSGLVVGESTLAAACSCWIMACDTMTFAEFTSLLPLIIMLLILVSSVDELARLRLARGVMLFLVVGMNRIMGGNSSDEVEDDGEWCWATPSSCCCCCCC